MKDIIIRGGENLSPGLIESAISAHFSVKACAVIGMPDADLGEIPVAFVVANDGHRCDERALRIEVEKRLSRIHVPTRVIELRALPENSVGKIDRKALKTLVPTL